MNKLDTRSFSRYAFEALKLLRNNIASEKHQKASAIVQGLPAYISTWGLHRLAGDGVKFSDPKKETAYKGQVYRAFLINLKTVSQSELDLTKPETLINSGAIDTHHYLGLNRLAIELAQEWSFWSVAVLGEAEAP